MEVKNNTTKGGFSKAWDLVPGGKQFDVRVEIMEKCDWSSRQTFYNKLSGRYPVTNPELMVLKNILEPYNIDPETGEYIKQLV
ncbi:MAG TPA: hypothetical protein DHV48_03440 [Prolixibacteraceae bacterium]|nr:hypothetical protein [Prolixibacteraceae bacterium]